jgi:peptidoglycan hydrolase-like protein with peptidoglycan-binding domain
VLQNFLRDKGFFDHESTGFYGDVTVQAVKKYQESVGLPATGMVYDFTRSAIELETCGK